MPSLERVAESAGISPAEASAVLECAILDAALGSWGRGRQLEARYEPERGAVELFLSLDVVETVEPAEALTAVAQSAVAELGFEVGDQFLPQIFYRDEDAGSAREQWRQFGALLPRFDEVASGLPPPPGPAWLLELWPVRRMPWRWGAAIVLPPLAEALELIVAWLRNVQPAALAETGFSSELVIDDCRLATPQQAAERKQLMERVAELWSPSWWPLLFNDLTVICVDEQSGRIVKWFRDGPEISELAPSLEVWLGQIAFGIQHQLVTLDVDRGLELDVLRDELRLLRGAAPPAVRL